MRQLHSLLRLLIAAVLFIGTANAVYGQVPAKKREFRGAWIQCVNGQFQGIGTEEMQRTLRYQLDELQRDGVNAIIFQVRAECDALYPSKYEPWSKFLTGRQGTPPSPYWDPLQWMITECHDRGMELHAWVNPYRGASNTDVPLASNHPARRFPHLYIKYGKQLVMDPGNPQSITYIASVIKDIVQRYDVDGIHFDDYFYPYPKDGVELNDDESFSRYGLSTGYEPDQKDRWRRTNVNQLIYTIRQTLLETKPWVRFGISPFGIYRNQGSWSRGSKTSGLQAYDDLSADVLHWAKEGWIDYVIPQIFQSVLLTVELELSFLPGFFGGVSIYLRRSPRSSTSVSMSSVRWMLDS